MATNINLAGAVPPISTVCTQLRVTLPGGLNVQGTVPRIAADPLDIARATIGSLNAALAPLGPVFSILDAVLALVKFAQSVPKVVTRPDKVLAAVADVLKKTGALARLIPQLSIPLMVLGCIDVLLAFLDGISDELSAIAGLDARVSELETIAQEVASMGPIAANVRAQVDGRRAQLMCAMHDAQPLLGIINVFCDIVGLPKISVDVDLQTGSLEDAAAALAEVVAALREVRSKIPV